MDRVRQTRERLANTIAEAARQNEERARGPLPPELGGVHFDPNDGHKRVLITVSPEGKFLPIVHWGMESGFAETGAIIAHATLIFAETVAPVVYAHEIASLGRRDGE